MHFSAAAAPRCTGPFSTLLPFVILVSYTSLAQVLNVQEVIIPPHTWRAIATFYVYSKEDAPYSNFLDHTIKPNMSLSGFKVSPPAPSIDSVDWTEAAPYQVIVGVFRWAADETRFMGSCRVHWRQQPSN